MNDLDLIRELAPDERLPGVTELASAREPADRRDRDGSQQRGSPANRPAGPGPGAGQAHCRRATRRAARQVAVVSPAARIRQVAATAIAAGPRRR